MNINQLKLIIKDNYQTITFFGDLKDDLIHFIIAHGLRGVDRIVPVGNALDIGHIWDGYDIISEISRIIK